VSVGPFGSKKTDQAFQMASLLLSSFGVPAPNVHLVISFLPVLPVLPILPILPFLPATPKLRSSEAGPIPPIRVATPEPVV